MCEYARDNSYQLAPVSCVWMDGWMVGGMEVLAMEIDAYPGNTPPARMAYTQRRYNGMSTDLRCAMWERRHGLANAANRAPGRRHANQWMMKKQWFFVKNYAYAKLPSKSYFVPNALSTRANQFLFGGSDCGPSLSRTRSHTIYTYCFIASASPIKNILYAYAKTGVKWKMR